MALSFQSDVSDHAFDLACDGDTRHFHPQAVIFCYARELTQEDEAV